MRGGLRALYSRFVETPRYIDVRPDVMMGKPCLRGTRIPVYLIVEKLGAGETVEEILAAYPQLTREHVAAARELGRCGVTVSD